MKLFSTRLPAVTLICLALLAKNAVADPPAILTKQIQGPSGEIVTVEYTLHSNRSPTNFKIFVPDGNGGWKRHNPRPVSTYIGRVKGRPGAIAAGLLRKDGTFWTRISFEGGLEWEVKGGIADSRGGFFNSPAWPTTVLGFGGAGSKVFAAELGLELSNRYVGRAGGGIDEAVEVAEFCVMATNAIYLRDAAIIHRIGSVVVRMDAATDPYDSASSTNQLLETVRNQWRAGVPMGKTHDVALVASSAVNGGLAWVRNINPDWGYSAQTTDGDGDFTVLWRHEVGHNWGSSHYEGRESGGSSPEGATIMSGNATSRFSSSELVKIVSYRKVVAGRLERLGSYEMPLPPRANMDRYNTVYDTPNRLDPLYNDSDSNGQEIRILEADLKTKLGGSVEISRNTGPNGRDELIYTPPSPYNSGTDSFSYRIVDTDGQTSTSWVTLRSSKFDPSIDNKILAHWPLDEGSGTTARDYTIVPYDGLVKGGASWLADGRIGSSAMQFDGIDSVVDAEPLRARTNTLTITGWVRRDGDQAEWAGLVFSRLGDSVGYGLSFKPHSASNSMLSFTWPSGNNPSWNFDSGLVLPDQVWTFCALTVSPGEAILYMQPDGQAMQSASARGEFGLSNFDAGLKLGFDPHSTRTRRFVGAMDDVRIYSRTLSAAEIAALASVNGSAVNPNPAVRATVQGSEDLTLSWDGPSGNSYDVYVGTDFDAVKNASTASPEFVGAVTGNTMTVDPPAAGVIYWRVDARSLDATVAGPVWFFDLLPRKEKTMMLAHWPLDEGSGTTAADYTLVANDGLVKGGASWLTEGRIGSSAIRFDGTDSVVEAEALSSSNSAVVSSDFGSSADSDVSITDLDRVSTGGSWKSVDNFPGVGAINSFELDRTGENAAFLWDGGSSGYWTRGRLNFDEAVDFSSSQTLVINYDMAWSYSGADKELRVQGKDSSGNTVFTLGWSGELGAKRVGVLAGDISTDYMKDAGASTEVSSDYAKAFGAAYNGYDPSGMGSFDLALQGSELTVTLGDGSAASINDITASNVASLEFGIRGKNFYRQEMWLDNISVVAEPAGARTNTLTITGWVRREGDQAEWAGLVYSRLGDSDSFGLSLKPDSESNSMLSFSWASGNNPSSTFDSGLVLPDQVWTFCALTVAPDEAILYMQPDGQAMQSASTSGEFGLSNFDARMKLGFDPHSTRTRRFVGAMDDVRIYSRTLSPAEIAALASSNGTATNPSPAIGATAQASENLTLSWDGPSGNSYDVYLGTDFDAVKNANTRSPEFAGTVTGNTMTGASLTAGTIYWRVDTQLGGATLEGPVWVFDIMQEQIQSEANGSWDDALTWSNDQAGPTTGIGKGNTYLIRGHTVSSNDSSSNSQALFGASLVVDDNGQLDLVREDQNQANIVDYKVPSLTLNENSALRFRASVGSVMHRLTSDANIQGETSWKIVGGSYENNVEWSGRLQGSGTINLLSNTSSPLLAGDRRTLSVSSRGNAFAGRWVVAHNAEGDDYVQLRADEVDALGTGKVELGRRAELKVGMPGGLDSISAVELNGANSLLELSSFWENPNAELMLTGGTPRVSLSAAGASIGTLSGNVGTIAGPAGGTSLQVHAQRDAVYSGSWVNPLRLTKKGAGRLSLDGAGIENLDFDLRQGVLQLGASGTKLRSLRMDGGDLVLQRTDTSSPEPVVAGDVAHTAGSITLRFESVPERGAKGTILSYSGTLKGSPEVTILGPDDEPLEAAIDYGAGSDSMMSFALNGPYDKWLSRHNIPSGRTELSDRNGPLRLQNILSYAMGIDPGAAVASDLPQVLGRATEPVAGMKVRFRRATDAPDILTTLQSSADLSLWSDAEILNESKRALDIYSEEVIVVVPEPETENHNFFRLHSKQIE